MKKKKILAVILVVVFIVLLIVPIPIPFKKSLSGIAYSNSQTDVTEPILIEIDGTYWLRVIGDSEFRGRFAVSTQKELMSETAPITAQIGLNEFSVKKTFPFFYSETGEGYVDFDELQIAYFSPFMSKVLLTNSRSVQEEECHIIAAPADTYEEAQELIKKLGAF